MTAKYPRRTIALGPPYDDGTVPGANPMTTTPSTEAGKRLWTSGSEDFGYVLVALSPDDFKATILEIEKQARAAGRAEAVEGLRALSEAATPGPWMQSEYGEDKSIVNLVDGEVDREVAPTDDVDEADAAFIAAAVNLIRELLREPKPEADHEHEWWDADDDETAWHCRICGLTEYPGDPGIGDPGTRINLAATPADESTEPR